MGIYFWQTNRPISQKQFVVFHDDLNWFRYGYFGYGMGELRCLDVNGTASHLHFLLEREIYNRYFLKNKKTWQIRCLPQVLWRFPPKLRFSQEGGLFSKNASSIFTTIFVEITLVSIPAVWNIGIRARSLRNCWNFPDLVGDDNAKGKIYYV